MAGLCPKYLNIRRGAYLLAIAGFVTNPWEYLGSAGIFLTVLSGFGVSPTNQPVYFDFYHPVAPITGLMLADYHVIRRYKLKIQDLYVGNSTSIYWYWRGIHWRAIICWVLGVFPTLPGLIVTVRNPEANDAWIKMFRITFFVGVSISFASYTLLCKIFPPPGLGLGESRHDDSMVFGLREQTSFEKMGTSNLLRSDIKPDLSDK
ncbi:hypothetical protein PQX77_022222 [Marasmius sp. AFHP31]|nr:hypothetical protein PQX77_022222 [Marasmius sp. AFHP31]